MKLSILILTHNRPELFKRCLNSVINIYPNIQVEILVNNDSCDITEIYNDKVQYFYYKDKDISNIYKFLFDKAKGEFIYFLEDDDYILPNFFNDLDLSYDLNYLNYRSYNIKETISRYNNCKIEVQNKDFQLGQILFKKNIVQNFPKGNAIDNDWNLLQDILKNTNKVIVVHSFMYQQTIDGNDNISFSHINKDKRWNISNKKD